MSQSGKKKGTTLLQLIKGTDAACHRHFPLPSNFRFIGGKPYCIYSKAGTSTIQGVDEKGQLSPAIPSEMVDKKRKLTKEEELLKQRKRDMRRGVTEFEVIEIGGKKKITFSSGLDVCLFDVEKNELEVVSGGKEVVKMDVKFTKDGKFFCFVLNDEIFVQNCESKDLQVQLTDDSKKPHVTAGVADYIIQEEFDRNTGYWVCPEKFDKEYCVAYLRVDSSMVPQISIPKGGFSNEFDTYYYPRPGEKNAVSTLVTLMFDEKMKVTKRVEHVDLLTKQFPWVEYVVDCGWVGKKLWMKLLDRRQKHFAVILFDPMTQSQEVVMEETEKTWINVTKHLYFFKDGSERVIVGSELPTGFHHLYLYEKDDNKKYKRTRTLTAGAWVVTFGKDFWIDEKNEIIYFVANKDSVLQTHLYQVSLTNSKDVKRLTPKDLTHEKITMADDFSKFVTVSSSVNSPYKCFLYTLKDGDATRGTRIRFGRNTEMDIRRDLHMIDCNLFSFVSSGGFRIYGAYYLPIAYYEAQLAKKKQKKGKARKKPEEEEEILFPTIVYVYGGPHAQIVKDTWLKRANHRAQLYCKLGYIYVELDNEGSLNRGKVFENVIHKRMGVQELETQVEGLELLMDEDEAHGLPIDPLRIGIHGYSYGGYLSLLAMAKHNDFFKLGLAGGPVTDWGLYDTGYTERYMDLPEKNEEGYKEGSVLTYVDQFPNEPHRVCILHGTADENVMFKNTEELVSRLVNLLKPVDVMIYPLQRHMFTNRNSRTHRRLKEISYFIEHL